MQKPYFDQIIGIIVKAFKKLLTSVTLERTFTWVRYYYRILQTHTHAATPPFRLSLFDGSLAPNRRDGVNAPF